MSAQNPNNTQLRAQGRKGNPLGALFTLIFLGASGYGLFYLWQHKDNLSNVSFLSSLNLPGSNNAATLSPSGNQVPNYNDPNAGGNFSQTQPIEMQQNAQPTKRKTRKVSTKNDQVNSAAQNLSSAGQVAETSSLLNSANGYIASKNLTPKEGLVEGTVDSLIAYEGNRQNSHLASKPDQIVTFKTNFYSREKALEFAANKLASLGFAKISIPVDDYLRGGATVVEGIDKFGNQFFMSFKPIKEGALTAWKAEIYKKSV